MNSGSAFLDRIVATQRDAVSSVSAAARLETREKALAIARNASKHRLKTALQRNDRINIIAEVKRSSPSAGTIRKDSDAIAIAQSYERAAATAISVLTEREFFHGSLEDLQAVTSRVSVPVLRKDFIVDRHQVYEAAAAGASAVLLIVAALSPNELGELLRVAEEELGLDALVEAHTAGEIEAALHASAQIIGVNNRNLQTLQVSLQTSHELARYIRSGTLFISESGIRTQADIESLIKVGYRGFLIGEALMRAGDPAAALSALIEGVRA